MCTVTLIAFPHDDAGFVLTSNRDEAPGRKTLPPRRYAISGTTMCFPKDAVAGGTWLGLSARRRLICLLNGGREPHVRKPPYRKSRGIVVLDLLAAGDFEQAARSYELDGIEAFTLIAVDWKEGLQWYELVWDGQERHLKILPKIPHIWSSAPLYSTEMKEQRNSWFRDFLKAGRTAPNDVLDFHQNSGKGDPDVGVIMDRGHVKTRSISQLVHENGRTRFYYNDLEDSASPVTHEYNNDLED